MVMPSHGNIWSNQNALPATQNILTPKLLCIQYVLFKHLVLSASISTITVLDIFEASILLSYTFIYYYCSILFSTTPPALPSLPSIFARYHPLTGRHQFIETQHA